MEKDFISVSTSSGGAGETIVAVEAEPNFQNVEKMTELNIAASGISRTIDINQNQNLVFFNVVPTVIGTSGITIPQFTINGNIIKISPLSSMTSINIRLHVSLLKAAIDVNSCSIVVNNDIQLVSYGTEENGYVTFLANNFTVPKPSPGQSIFYSIKYIDNSHEEIIGEISIVW